MATARTTRSAAHRAHGTAAELDRAVKQLLGALPFGHLDQRLTAFQDWLAPVQKEVWRSGRRVGRAVAETARIALMGPGASHRRH